MDVTSPMRPVSGRNRSERLERQSPTIGDASSERRVRAYPVWGRQRNARAAPPLIRGHRVPARRLVLASLVMAGLLGVQDLAHGDLPGRVWLFAFVDGQTRIGLQWSRNSRASPAVTEHKVEACQETAENPVCDYADDNDWTVLVAAHPQAESPHSNKYTHSGLSADQTWHYRVWSKNSEGYGAEPGKASGTTAPMPMHMNDTDNPTCETARWKAYVTVGTFGANDGQGYRSFNGVTTDGGLDNQSFMLGDTNYMVTQLSYSHEQTNYPTQHGRWYFPASYHFAVTELPFNPGKLEDLTLYVGDVRLPLSSVGAHTTQGFGEAYRWGWSTRRWTEGMEQSPLDGTFDYQTGDRVLVCLTDTAPIVTLVLTPVSISESGSSNSSTVTATIEQGVDTEFTVTVFAEAVSPAVAGDFALSANKVLTFPANSTTSTGTVTITAVNNDVDAPDKTVTVKGEISNGARPADPDDVTLTITDDDDPPLVTIGDRTVTEGSDAEFEVSLGAESAREVTVAYASGKAGDTANSPADYGAVSGTLTFEAGDTAKTITVTTVNDTVDEDVETFTVTLSSPVNATLSGDVSELTATGTISDDDALALTVELSADEIAEAGGQSTVTVKTGGVTYADDQTITLELGGTATETADYTVSAKTLTLEAGSSSVTATVTAEQDFFVEGSEAVEIVAKHGTVTSPAQTLTISDDDALTVSVAGPATTVVEGQTATFTVTTVTGTSTEGGGGDLRGGHHGVDGDGAGRLHGAERDGADDSGCRDERDDRHSDEDRPGAGAGRDGGVEADRGEHGR